MNAPSPSIDTLLQKTKMQLFFHKGGGFFGSLLVKVGFTWTHEIDTAAISDSMLYWNPDFFLSLDEQTRVTVLAHELMHNAYLHGARLGDRCPDLWNIAGDHVINLYLKEHGFFMGGFPYCMDPKYKDWSTDQVYDDLNANDDPDQTSAPSMKDVMPCDPADIPKAVADVISAVTTARMTGDAGNIPGETVLVIDHFLNPKLPWEALLFNFFNELTSQEYSYQRPNRRYEDPILPGITGNNGLEHIVYALDISGSITDEHILRFNSEVKYIKDTLQPELLTLITFDTKVRDTYVFEKEDPFEKIVVTGRGGTSLADVFDKIKAICPTCAVIFTDLEVRIPENPGFPIIWVCVDNLSAKVPYGTLIHIRD